MKIISCCVLFAAALLCGCPENYDTLPEPELPVVAIEFSGAAYDSTEKTITMTFAGPFTYDGLFPTYNRERGFDMAEYLNGDFKFYQTRVADDRTGIIISLYNQVQVPQELSLKTTVPLYLYSDNYSYGYVSGRIEAKAFFKAASALPVTPAP
jgi:hypothetical protein